MPSRAVGDAAADAMAKDPACVDGRVVVARCGINQFPAGRAGWRAGMRWTRRRRATSGRHAVGFVVAVVEGSGGRMLWLWQRWWRAALVVVV